VDCTLRPASLQAQCSHWRTRFRMGSRKLSKPRGRRHAGVDLAVMNHPDYVGLSFSAKALLLEGARQYNSHNNGAISFSWAIMKHRGFRSKATLAKATRELLDAGMIQLTREGRFLNPGGICALYALTWHAIDECPGKSLSVGPTRTPPRNFSLTKHPVQKLGRVCTEIGATDEGAKA